MRRALTVTAGSALLTLGVCVAPAILVAPAMVAAEAAEAPRHGSAAPIVLAAEDGEVPAKAGKRVVKGFPKPKKQETPPSEPDDDTKPLVAATQPTPQADAALAVVPPVLFEAIDTADQETVTAIGQALAKHIENDQEGANQELFSALSRQVLGRAAELEGESGMAGASSDESVDTTESEDHDIAIGGCDTGAVCADLAARVEQFSAAQPTIAEEDGGLANELGPSLFDGARPSGKTLVSGEKDTDFFEVEKSREEAQGAEVAVAAADTDTDPDAGARATDETPYTQGARWNPYRAMSDVPSPVISDLADKKEEPEEETEEEAQREERESEAGDGEAAAPEEKEEAPIIPKGVRIGFQADALSAAMAVGLSARDIEARLLGAGSPDDIAQLASWSSGAAADALLQGRETVALDEVVVVSIRALVEGVETYGGDWSEMPDDLRYPGPMRRIHGYIVDRAAGDVRIVASPVGDGAPISLDELAVGADAVWRNGAEPLVSLDPDPEDMQGPHMARVAGVPFDSMFAKVMLDADYEMKFVTLLGRDVPFDDFRSGLQRLRESEGAVGVSYNRYWFVPGRPGPGDILTTPDGSAVLFDGAMVLQTEQMAATAGMLTGLGKRDPDSEAIATYFTDRMADFETAFPIFRQLHGVMDVSLMAMLWRTTGLDLPVLHTLAALPVPPTKVRKALPASTSRRRSACTT
jgi:hypothetical protein